MVLNFRNNFQKMAASQDIARVFNVSFVRTKHFLVDRASWEEMSALKVNPFQCDLNFIIMIEAFVQLCEDEETSTVFALSTVTTV